MMIFRLSDHGAVFSTRPKGASLRKLLLAQRSAGEEIHISFDKVQSVSYSFADEFLGPLVLGPDPVKLEDVPPAVGRIIEGTLRRRGLRTSQVEKLSAAA